MDARPGGYIATGGHGGIIGQVGHTGRLALTYLPAYKHTYLSDVRITNLPHSTLAVRKNGGALERASKPIKDAEGKLLPT